MGARAHPFRRCLGDSPLPSRLVILRFSGTPRDGHGQHQVSAILGKEAFFAAADPSRFPEQLKFVEPWKPRRLLFNSFSFTQEHGKGIRRDEWSHRGRYRRIQSRAGRFLQPDRRYEPQHASQPGHGHAAARAFEAIPGACRRRSTAKGFKRCRSTASRSHGRVPGGAPVGRMLDDAARTFRAGRTRNKPSAVVTGAPAFRRARPQMTRGRRETGRIERGDRAVRRAYGWTPKPTNTPWCRAPPCEVKYTALNRSRFR